MSDAPGYRKIDGLCAQTDPEAFFPEKGGSTRPAKRVCFACDERARCIRTVLDGKEAHGVWGGLSERDRRILQPHWDTSGGDGKKRLVALLLEVRTVEDLIAFLKPFRLANEAAARRRKAETEAAANRPGSGADSGGDLADAA